MFDTDFRRLFIAKIQELLANKCHFQRRFKSVASGNFSVRKMLNKISLFTPTELVIASDDRMIERREPMRCSDTQTKRNHSSLLSLLSSHRCIWTLVGDDMAHLVTVFACCQASDFTLV